jgi:hypothetical protein
MGNLTRHLLSLVAGVMLALPPGWCCILAPAAAVAAERPSVPGPPACCPGCCPEPSPAQDEQPPSRAPCTVCCGDQNVPLSKRATDYAPDATVAALPVTVAVLPGPGGAPGRIAPAWPLSPPRALHLLQCVWLC